MNIEKTNNYPESDARHHALNISHALKELAEHARGDVGKVDDKRGRVLFETTAEVLLGLSTACEHFVEQNEPAMKI